MFQNICNGISFKNGNQKKDIGFKENVQCFGKPTAMVELKYIIVLSANVALQVFYF
jgi:hypothetical protein